jgi:tripartite-type tricarboxylate transporter receptor subunit TctC
VMPNAMPHVVAKSLKGLAVSTLARWPNLDLPTIAESGLPGFSLTAWDALLMPKGSPPTAISKINEAANKALSDPELQKTLLARGSEAVSGTPEDLRTFMISEFTRWGDVVRAAGATIE